MSPLASYKAFLRGFLAYSYILFPGGYEDTPKHEIHRGGEGRKGHLESKTLFEFSAALIPTMHSE